MDQYGVLNYILKFLHLPTPLWLASPQTAMWAIIIVDIWLNFPFVMLVLSAGLASIPQELVECAAVDGANYWQRLRWIILPLMRPTMLVVILMRCMSAFKLFDTVYVLTGGGPGVSTETVSTYTYRVVFNNLNFEGGGAIAVIATIILVLFAVLLTRILHSEEVV